MRRRAGLSAALAVVALAACSNGSPARAVESPAGGPTCAVSQLELGPDGMAPNGLAHAGPLWFSGFGTYIAGAEAVLPPAGGPPDGRKVVVVPDPASSGLVELSGTDCENGAAVRFCYSQCSWETRLQDSVAVLRVDTSGLDLGGYMVFPGPGLMRLTVTKDGQTAGQTVLEVPPQT